MSLELDDLGSGFNRSKLNSNTQTTEDYVNDNLLHRDGVVGFQDNSMKVNLDMNSKRILNLPAPSSDNEPVRVRDLPTTVRVGDKFFVPSFTESVVLTSGQTEVTLTQITTTQTAFYIGGDNVDRGRLIPVKDYLVNSGNELTLTDSYPEGTILTGIQNESVEGITSDVQVFDNIASMKAGALNVGDVALCKRYYSGGNLVDGLLFEIQATQAVDEIIDHSLTNGNTAKNISSGTLTFSIPSDFSTLQEAYDVLKLGSSTKRDIVLNIESGHALTGGLSVKGGDASNISITSSDATVSLDAGFVGVEITEPDYIVGEVVATYPRPLFYFFECVAPNINCLIDMGNNHGEGIFLINSKGFVATECGVINAGRRGLNARNSIMYADGSNFSGANSTGVRAQLTANVSVGSSDISNCCKTLEQSNGAVYVSRSSSLELRFADVSNSGGRGLVARRSIVSAANVNFNNSAQEAIVAESVAKVDAIESTAGGTSPSVVLYVASFNSEISCASVSVTTPSDVNKVFRIRTGGIISVNSGTTIDAVEIDRTNVFLESGAPNFDFNTVTGYGIVFKENERPSRQTASVGIWKVTYYSDGTYDAWLPTPQIINTGTVASGDFSGQLTLPAKDASFLTVEDYSIEVDGRTSAGGGGSRVFVNSCVGNSSYTANEFKIQNTGQRLDGTNTAFPVESIAVKARIKGSWR